MPETIDVAKLLAGEGLEEARKAIEAGEAIFKTYALPRPKLKIRSTKKRLVSIDEGKLNRLEYALVYTVLKAIRDGKKPVFEDFAKSVGDYKAAAAYLAFLWRSGIVSFSNPQDAANIYVASSALSQKTYEHKISKAIKAEFSVNTENLAKLPSDNIACIYRDGNLACRYIVANCERGQAKAQIRGVFDALMK
ncbi:hypothetical protein PYJP_10600 [Pyrofollis japonicus]|uniref:hypothetical protein n=1 Tax=Pyrofollis japonicus TaxID=3060460 RepID=UPI00295AEFA2|nr:hypothetical protein [Pyrofollis japonicus]BEP17708.1 hypothetical protein PYJP_10600 [Pyrofollis japonicus]